MKLYIADSSLLSLSDVNGLARSRREKTQRLVHKKDKLCSIAAGLMIKRFAGAQELYKNEYGKPCAENGVHFNVSHSGRYVLLAVSDVETGCDIEQVRYADALKTGGIVFCEEEMEMLSASACRLDTFFELWTKKESFLKCTGEGFHRKAKSVNVCADTLCDNGKKYYFKTWKFSDFTVSACSPKNNFPKELEFVSLKSKGL